MEILVVSAAWALICAAVLHPARAILAIAGLAALAGVTAAYAETLAREPGDLVYLPSLAIRADGRLALAPGVTIAEAAGAYAGPADYWAASCRATLPGWRWPVDWRGSDAIGRTLWRASVSDSGAVMVDGLAPAEADPLHALLAELAPIVACGE
ncbi:MULTISPECIES: hypothetical protein [Methylosinus]|uniref:Uncharacterized protein n=1 Tax=Methylosinus trichosporium (strain ATCC 35070 / NCIMB 11131 / UNIQEM 75 / OB3b) TaxID=595536 RepID=A0A2D2CYL4_METT3|nr:MULTISPECIES: hypothetical protein [Methylosinus]ATQ67827.1 hypothetical protein CQW49_07905 [Methylosinus trichosporium OB3b]OBS51847.1 hypothetical protein A8B73_14430 [Methylosinus sp. 3S-1]